MQRVNIQQCQPEAYDAMFGLEKYMGNSTLDADLQEIIRLRASVLNGCQFCTDMHSKAAKKLGVSDEKIDALADWQQSSLFSDKEQAALAMTDSVTHISAKGLPEHIYQKVAKYFREEEIAQLIMLMAVVNAWNRMGISMAG